MSVYRMPVLLNINHEEFAREYVQSRHAQRSAHKVYGCSWTSASAQAAELLANPRVQARIRELAERMLKAADITAQRVMLELGRVAFGDIRGAFDEQGRLRPIHELDDDAAACISGIEVEERPAETVIDNETGAVRTVVPVVKKLKRYDKNPALGLLAKHFKLVGDEGDGANALASALADRLAEARRRANGVRVLNSADAGDGDKVPRLEGAIPPVADAPPETESGVRKSEARVEEKVPVPRETSHEPKSVSTNFTIQPTENAFSKNLQGVSTETGTVQNQAPSDDDERLW